MERMPGLLVWGALLGLLVLPGERTRASGEPASAAPEMLGDAELHDVCFLDQDRGWAVGDRGVIWETSDGGRQWNLVDSPTTACLRSIHFLDEQHGWIVGGWIHPFTQRTSGVLLRTENGGRKWTKESIPILPALRGVTFLDSRRGWAWGESSPIYPTGIFRTQDGGATWESTPGLPPVSPQVGCSIAGRPACFVAPDRTVWTWNGGQIQPSRDGLRLPRTGRGLHATDGVVWLVGDAGMVLRSNDGGALWQTNPLHPGQELAREFDWETVFARGNQCWIAGTPGTIVLRSDDGGRTWRKNLTGQSAPIRKLCFTDEQHGWAVGALGRILATRDGGNTWRVQRSGGERAGMLAVAPSIASTPLAVIAQAAADEGVLTVVESWSSPPTQLDLTTTTSTLVREAAQLDEAVSLAGGSSARVWPGSTQIGERGEPGLLPSTENDLARRLVLSIRTWRPEVVVTGNAISGAATRGGGTNEAATAAWQTLVLQAVQDAADPARYSEQVHQAGLQPWSPRKVLAVAPSREVATMSQDLRRVSIRLGCCLADYCTAARGVLLGSPAVANVVADDIAGCRLLWSQAQFELAGREIMSGIPTGPAGDYRRPPGSLPTAELESLSRATNQLRNLQEIALRSEGGGDQAGGWFPQLEQLLQAHPPISAGRILHRLAEKLQQAGKYGAAAECYSTLLTRMPDHPLGDSAAWWLLRYHASAEMRHGFSARELTRLPATSATATSTNRTAQSPSRDAREANAGRPQPAGAILPWQAPAAAQAIPVAHPVASRVVIPAHAEPDWQIAEWIRQTRPALYADPRVQFTVLAMARRARRSDEATKILNILGGSNLPPTWRLIARQEQKLQERAPLAVRPTAHSLLTTTPPLLDGRLTEDAWTRGTPVPFTGQDGSLATTVWFAHDTEFLYLAARGDTPTGPLSEQADRAPRTRDAGLSGRDHLRLQLDIDRDYHVAYQLAFDRSGRAQDTCGGDARWNPQWYVASASERSGDLESWTAEAAIPWTELVEAAPQPGDHWGLRIQRQAPDQAPLAWPNPAVAGVGEVGYGLLRFSSPGEPIDHP